MQLAEGYIVLKRINTSLNKEAIHKYCKVLSESTEFAPIIYTVMRKEEQMTNLSTT